MKVFNFLWHDYEEQDNHLFSHPDKTEEQFREDCKRALIEVGDSYMDNQVESWVTLFDWVSIASKKLEEYGYTKINPITFSLWGNYIIEEDRDEFGILKDIVGERLISKAVSKNKIIQEKVYKE
jgi:hypothetical protein